MELQKQFASITQLIAKAKERAFHAVNKELLGLYWNIGEYVSKQVEAKAWGKSVVQELANYIQTQEPNVKGFSAQNIWRMKQFYETYKDFPNLATVWREINWSQHKLIMPCKTPEEREFYIKLTIKERWSVRELERQINTSYYERVMLGNAKLAPKIGGLPQDIANTFKDTYVLELLNLPDIHKESDLLRHTPQIQHLSPTLDHALLPDIVIRLQALQQLVQILDRIGAGIRHRPVPSEANRQYRNQVGEHKLL